MRHPKEINHSKLHINRVVKTFLNEGANFQQIDGQSAVLIERHADAVWCPVDELPAGQEPVDVRRGHPDGAALEGDRRPRGPKDARVEEREHVGLADRGELRQRYVANQP